MKSAASKPAGAATASGTGLEKAGQFPTAFDAPVDRDFPPTMPTLSDPVWLAHLVATAGMAGVIWTVQLVRAPGAARPAQS
jgi:hypothetical protein